MRSLLGLLSFLATLGCAAPSGAQPTPFKPATFAPISEALSLSAGATCLEQEMLVGRVARWLGRDQIEVPIAVRVAGHATRVNHVSFVIDRGGGKRAERSIADGPSDCDQLHSAVALSIALAIDASDANAVAGETAEELPDDEALLMPEEKPGPPYFRLALGAFGHATSGVLSDVAWGGSARLELGFWRWLDLRAGVFGASVSDQTLASADPDEARFAASLLVGRVDACLAHGLALQFRAMVCGSALAGSFRTVGSGSAIDAFVETSPWLAGAGSIEAQAELQSWLSLAVSLELVVPLIRHRVALQDERGARVGRPRELLPAGILVGIGLIVRIF